MSEKKEKEEQIETMGEKKEPSESLKMVSAALKAARRLEDANERMSELLAQQEKLHIERTLAGHAEVKEVKKEETDAEYAKRVMNNDL